MSWIRHQAEIEQLAEGIEPSAKVVIKEDHWLSYVLAWFLFIVSFGRFKRKDFLTKYANVVGHLILIPRGWSYRSAKNVVPHEARHVLQCKRMGGNIHPALGIPVAAIVYGLLLLPVFLSIGRVLMEVDADKAKWATMLRSTYADFQIEARAQERATALAGKGYLWAAPRFFTSWIYKRAAKKVINEYKA